MDYLSKYGTGASTPKFQAGGPMPAGGGEAMSAEGAPAQGGGGNIEAMLQQYAQTRDPQLAVQIADELLAMMSGGGGGQGAPAPAMEKGGRMNYSAPMFKKGGKL